MLKIYMNEQQFNICCDANISEPLTMFASGLPRDNFPLWQFGDPAQSPSFVATPVPLGWVEADDAYWMERTVQLLIGWILVNGNFVFWKKPMRVFCRQINPRTCIIAVEFWRRQ